MRKALLPYKVRASTHINRRLCQSWITRAARPALSHRWIQRSWQLPLYRKFRQHPKANALLFLRMTWLRRRCECSWSVRFLQRKQRRHSSHSQAVETRMWLPMATRQIQRRHLCSEHRL